MIINGKHYEDAHFTFNTICDLGDMGFQLETADRNSLGFIRAYVAICMKKPLEYAGEEIEKHILEGGELKEIIDTITREVEKSGFFQKLTAKAKEAEPEKKAKPEVLKAEA